MEEQIFEPHKGLPTYEWNKEAKKKYLQAASNYKETICSRNEHLNALYEHLVGCERFFLRVNRIVKVVAADMIKELNEEVIDQLTLINRVRCKTRYEVSSSIRKRLIKHSTSRRVKLLTTQPKHLPYKKMRWIKT